MQTGARWPGPDARAVAFPGPDVDEPPSWPGADIRRVAFAGRDDRAELLPGPDARAVLFPPAPRFVVAILAQALGAGSASCFVTAIPWRFAPATGGGIAAASVSGSVAITAAATGGGIAAAVVVNAEILAAAVGGGSASAVVVAALTHTAGAVGGGGAGVVGFPVATVSASAAGLGAGAAVIHAGALVAGAATGGGVAGVTMSQAAKYIAGAVGGGTASAAVYVGYRYADDFNRADSADIGTNWRNDRNGPARITSNRAQMKTMASGNGRAGNWSSYQGGGGTAAGRFGTDNYAVKAQLIAPTGNLASDNMTGLVLAVGDTFGAGVMAYCVMTTGSGCAIYTQSGLPPTTGISTGQTGQTQRAVTATNAAATDLFEFRRVGNVFTLYRNNVSFLTWTDSGNLVSTGSTFRRWGFLVEGNFPIFQSEFRSPAVDSIQAYDL
ncbi:DUF7257 domain-containing protein [Nocardia brasiliensis]|uniref:DUF7257 domain-containing protein n=1 Tax=Nocardia brasiliensis TaxID=37326 RepID=UPI0033F3FE75